MGRMRRGEEVRWWAVPVRTRHSIGRARKGREGRRVGGSRGGVEPGAVVMAVVVMVVLPGAEGADVAFVVVVFVVAVVVLVVVFSGSQSSTPQKTEGAVELAS